MSIGRILMEMGKLTPDDIENVLRVQNEKNLRFGEAAALLGLISDVDMQQVLFRQFGYSSLQPGDAPFPLELVAAYRPFDPNVETLRAVRNQLTLLWFSRGHKALSVASINSGEGASFVVANLAVLFSQLGENTLLIDANLRNPRQHEIFSLTQRQGLSDVLVKRAGLETIVPSTHFDKLSVLTAGTIPPNPQELVSAAPFAALYEIMASRFDVILYDVAAFAVGADGLAACAGTGGGMLLVAHKDKTRMADIHAVGSRLATGGVEIVGSVLLDF